MTADKFRYTEAKASTVMRQLLNAVSYLHSLNIAHRNIRLENILVSLTYIRLLKVNVKNTFLERHEN